MSRLNALFGFVVATIAATGAHAQVNLSAETGSPGSVPGATVIALSEVAARSGVADIQVATEQTLTNSIQNVAEGKTDITAAPFILPFLLNNGVGPYAGLGKEAGAELAGNLKVLYTYRFASLALYAYDSRNFGGWEAVEGATIFNGPPRGGALGMGRAVLQLVTGLEDGEGYTGLQVNWGQAVQTIQEGASDAMMLPISFPDARMTAALASGDMTVWSVPKDVYEGEAFQKYANAPGNAPVAVDGASLGYPSGVTLVSEDGMFRSVGSMGGELVNASMDFDMAKALTAAFIAGLDDVYRAKTPATANAGLGDVDASVTGMCGPNPLKYHPGAVAAWEEAGYSIPDCAK